MTRLQAGTFTMIDDPEAARWALALACQEVHDLRDRLNAILLRAALEQMGRPAEDEPAPGV